MDLYDIGQKIRSERKLSSLTQVQLAENANVSRYTLSKLENGQATDVQFKVLQAILSILRLELIVTNKSVSAITVLGEK